MLSAFMTQEPRTVEMMSLILLAMILIYILFCHKLWFRCKNHVIEETFRGRHTRIHTHEKKGNKWVETSCGLRRHHYEREKRRRRQKSYERRIGINKGTNNVECFIDVSVFSVFYMYLPSTSEKKKHEHEHHQFDCI